MERCALPWPMSVRLFNLNPSSDAKGAKGEVCLDGELLGLMQSNETLEQRVARLFELLRNPVYYYLLAALNDAAEAEDITQETFLRLYAQLHRGRAVENVRLYVFRVAHNLAFDERRRGQSLTWLDAPSSEQLRALLSEGGLNPEQQALRQEKYERLQAGLRRLSPQERQCLLLRFEGLPYREIGDVLGIGVSTAADCLRCAAWLKPKSVNRNCCKRSAQSAVTEP